MNLHDKYLQQEEMKSDSGWKKTETERKDQYGNRIRNVARRLARQGMQSAIKDLKKGPEAGKRQVEEVDHLDELSKNTLADYAKKATHDSRIKHGIGKDFERISKSSRKPEYKQSAKEWEDKYKSDARRREAGVNKAIDRLAKEEVELDEAMRHKIAGAIGQFIGNKIDPVHGEIMRVHGEEAYRQAAYHIRKTLSGLHDTLKKHLSSGNLQTEGVEELEELKRDTLNKYITRTRFSSDPKRRIGAQKAMAKVGQKPKQEKPVSEALDEEIGYSPRGHRDLATHHFNKAKELYQKADSADNSGDSYGADHLNDVAGKHAWAYHAHKEASTDPKKSADAHKASREANNMIESVEELEELKKSTLASYADKAEKDIKAKKDEFKAQGGQMRKKSQRDLDAKITKRYQGLFTAQRKAGLPIGFKEDVEELEELKVSTLTRYGTKAMQAYGRNPEKDDKRLQGIQRARAKVQQKAMNKEEVDLISKYSKLGEAKYPGFRVRTTSGTFGGPKLPRRPYVSQGDTDPRTGLPLGFSNPPKSDKPEDEKDKVKK